MTYDYHSAADGVTGANAPLFDKNDFAVVISFNTILNYQDNFERKHKSKKTIL